MQGVVVVSTGKAISLFDSFYFSLCTISASCYGELMPLGISRIIGSLEVITGLILFGMFISKLVGARTSKMLEKIYEMQFKQKLREHRNTWARQRACLDKVSMIALNPKIQNAKKEEEIAFHIKNKTAENHLKIINSSMNACVRFLKENYFVSFIDKKFDDEVLPNLLHSMNITLKHINKSVTRLDRSKISWLNSYGKENLRGICEVSLEITELIERRFTNPIPEKAVETIPSIKKEINKIRRKLDG
jgi:hypothetical protein